MATTSTSRLRVMMTAVLYVGTADLSLLSQEYQESAYDPYKGVDPVLKTGQMGFLLSKEAGNSMNILNIAKDAACRMDDSGNCSPVAKPTYGASNYILGQIPNATVK